MESSASATINYNITIEDVVAFNLHFIRTSKTQQKSKRKVLFVLPIATFLMTTGLIGQSTSDMGLAVASGLAAALVVAGYFVFYNRYIYPGRMKRMVRTMIDENSNPGMIGPRTLTVDELGICFTSSVSKTQYSWSALAKIESEPKYTYLYTSSINALVVPHDSLEDGELLTMLAVVQRHYHPDKELLVTVT